MKATQRDRTLYEDSFAVIGLRLWNTIPHNITTKTNKDSFKVALSKYMDKIPDEPPIDGFSRHNSLLDYNRLQLAGGRSEADVDSWSAVTDDVGCYEQLSDGRHHRSSGRLDENFTKVVLQILTNLLFFLIFT